MPAKYGTARGAFLSTLLPEGISVAVENPFVSGVSLDSRKVQPGDLFLAVKGINSDGRDFIENAVKAGCVAIVAEKHNFEACTANQEKPPVPLMLVENLEQHLSALAGRFYGQPGEQIQLVGITGTNAKTTCCYLLAQLLAATGVTAATIGTLGSGIAGLDTRSMSATGMTTPDGIKTQQILSEFVAAGVQTVAMEVSSHSLDQFRVAGLTFDVAIFTNLSRDHLDYHGDMATYGATKARLFSMPGVKTAVINADDPFGETLLRQLPPSITAISYSVGHKADVEARNLSFDRNGLSADINTPWGQGHLTSSLLGAFNLSNLLAVVAAAGAMGLTLDKVLDHVSGLQSVPGRMEVVDKNAQPQVVIDYAHTPDALEKALNALRHHCRGKLWCVFGCGGDRDQGKRPQMGAIAAQLADQLVVTSDNPRSEQPAQIIAAIVAGISDCQAVHTNVDRGEAIRFAIANATADDTVLIAGKGHEDYQQIGVERLPFSDIAEARLALCGADRSSPEGISS